MFTPSLPFPSPAHHPGRNREEGWEIGVAFIIFLSLSLSFFLTLFLCSSMDLSWAIAPARSLLLCGLSVGCSFFRAWPYAPTWGTLRPTDREISFSDLVHRAIFHIFFPHSSLSRPAMPFLKCFCRGNTLLADGLICVLSWVCWKEQLCPAWDIPAS